METNQQPKEASVEELHFLCIVNRSLYQCYVHSLHTSVWCALDFLPFKSKTKSVLNEILGAIF